jgi:hypothetical protein
MMNEKIVVASSIIAIAALVLTTQMANTAFAAAEVVAEALVKVDHLTP